MGIFIKLDIVPSKISKKDWELTYQEAAHLIQGYPFLDIFSDEVSYNCVWNYADSSVEREISYCDNQVGFRLRGNLVTMETAESFELIKDLAYYQVENSNRSCEDVLESYGEESPGIVAVFNDKTQGYHYHTYILAIACLFESRLKPYAMVSGDISRGQMEEAIAWANNILDQPIQLSDRANNELLLVRIKKVTADGLVALSMFMDSTLNEKDLDLGNFIKMSFHKQIIIKYYTERIASLPSGTFGFSNIISEYLDLGNDLADLCSIYITKDPSTDEIKWFIKKILSLNIHLEAGNENKSSQQYIDEQLSFQSDKPTSKTPDNIDSLFAKLFLKMEGGTHHQPNIYIPLDKLRQIFKEKFTDIDDIDGLIDEYLAKSNSKKEEQADSLEKPPLSQTQASSPAVVERYDIENLSDLILWKPGDTIYPSLENYILEMKTFVEKDLAKFMEPFKAVKEKKHKMAYLINSNEYLILSKKSWDYIYEHLEEEDIFSRVAKIMTINAGEVNINRLCLSLLNNTMLFEKFFK